MAGKTADKGYNGVLPVYKEKGYTSNDVVAKLRGILHMKKIGHTGTLDPEATGVLPVCLGKATRLVGFLTDSDKSYECVMRLGVESDTEDMSGQILNRRDTAGIKDEDIASVLKSFEGEYDQIPPMYSAKKINGKKLYEIAREGKVVERKPSRVFIYHIGDPGIKREDGILTATFTVDCSKGTYIRSLCRDAGSRIGCGGAMQKLERTKAAGIIKEECLKIGEIEEIMKYDGRIEDHILPVDHFYLSYERLTVQGDIEKKVRNGNKFRLAKDDGIYRVYLQNGEFAAVYEIKEGEARLCRFFLI